MSAAPKVQTRFRGRTALGIVAVLVLLAGAALAWLQRSGSRVHTDDAFVEATLVMVSSQVSGRVREVLVSEHDPVRAGQVLVRLDSSEYALELEAASARLDAARNRLVEAEAASAAADADGRAAAVERQNGDQELERVSQLRSQGAASQRDLDNAQMTRDVAEARANALVLRAKAERVVLGNQAPVREATASLNEAALELEHTEILAPFDGIVGRTNVEPGAVVNPSQPLLMLVSDRDVWVMANFKETQIARMRVGAPAEIRIDAFPDAVCRGRVASFSPATGAEYALIRPEPAAGNFTKVVQRIPVKIELDGCDGPMADPLGGRLAAGLSAEVSVVVE